MPMARPITAAKSRCFVPSLITSDSGKREMLILNMGAKSSADILAVSTDTVAKVIIVGDIR